jgi:hypothetical protein
LISEIIRELVSLGYGKNNKIIKLDDLDKLKNKNVKLHDIYKLTFGNTESENSINNEDKNEEIDFDE